MEIIVGVFLQGSLVRVQEGDNPT